jgi:group I intron endonuclease
MTVKNKKIAGVYKITNPFNQIYIGQSKDIERRFLNHKNGSFSNSHLCLSIQKHGLENHIFEIIEECDLNDLVLRERFYLTLYRKDYVMFNFTVDGTYDEKLLIRIKEYGLLKLGEYQKILAQKEAILNKYLNLNTSVQKKILKALGREECKRIAEEAINKEYQNFLNQPAK